MWPSSLGNRVELILDGGACPVGIESTVVDVSGPSPVLLRHGGVTQEDIEAVIGKLATATPSAAPKSPGQLESHYAPALPLRLDARDVKPDEALLAFGPEIPSGATHNGEPQPLRRSRGGRRQSLRHAAPLDGLRLPRHRRDAGSRHRPRPRHQRPPAPRRDALADEPRGNVRRRHHADLAPPEPTVAIARDADRRPRPAMLAARWRRPGTTARASADGAPCGTRRWTFRTPRRPRRNRSCHRHPAAAHAAPGTPAPAAIAPPRSAAGLAGSRAIAKSHPAVAKIADAVEQHNRTASSGARDVRVVAPHHAVMTSRKPRR